MQAQNCVEITDTIKLINLQNSLESIAKKADAAEEPAKGSGGTIDIEVGDTGQLYLYLDIPLAGIPITYSFEMLPVARESVDVLESLLHDAQDEITALTEQVRQLEATKTKSQPVLISLRSSTASSYNDYVTWNLEEHNTDTECFERAANQQSVTVKKRGFYQISVRLTDNSSNGNSYTAVYINGAAPAHAYCGQNTGYLNSITINDIFLLEANAVVQIFNSSNANTCASGPASIFTILKL